MEIESVKEALFDTAVSMLSGIIAVWVALLALAINGAIVYFLIVLGRTHPLAAIALGVSLCGIFFGWMMR